MVGEHDRVRYDVAGGIATITFNRPDKLNAITFAMREEFIGLIDRAGADGDVRVVVVQGAGRAFTCGVDLDDHADVQDPAARTYDEDLAEISRAADRWLHLWNLTKPVVVKTQGYCYAWGLEIAMHADLVVSTDDCQFAFPSIRNGSGLPDSSLAIYGLGLQWARWLLYTGDPIDGATAEKIGLVWKAVPAEQLDRTVAELAGRIAALPPELIAQSKAVINESVELMGREELQRFAARANATARRSPAAAEFSRRVRQDGRRAAVAWRDGLGS